MEVVSLATTVNSCDFDSLEQLITQYKNDIASLTQDAIDQFKAVSSDIDDIRNLVADINSKLTEDTVDTINNLGTPDDFQLGFYDAFNGA